jgi:hypothetical protein
MPSSTSSADPHAIRQAWAAARHLLEMYRRQISDNQIRRKLNASIGDSSPL